MSSTPTPTMDVPFIRLAERMLDFLEKYQDDLPPGPDGRGPVWKDFITRIWEQENEDSEQLVSYLSGRVNSEDRETMEKSLKKSSYRDCYKLVLALRSPNKSNDTRLRDIFKLAIRGNPPFSVKVDMLKARFISSASNRSKGPPPTKMIQYNTEPATTFELLFFFIVICSISPMCERENKKRRKNTTGAPQRKRDYAQVLGYGVQAVIRAWDSFAAFLKFRDSQDLLSPYIIFDPDALVYNLIENHEKGFSPSRQSHTLQGIEGPTKDKTECNEQAWSRDTQYDKDLRTLAGTFRDDIYDLVPEEDIFKDGEEAIEIHPKLRKFVGRDCFLDSQRLLSTRFNFLSKSLIDRVSMARKRELELNLTDAQNIPSEVDVLVDNFPKFQQLPEYIIHFAGGISDQNFPICASEVPFSSWERSLRQLVSDVPVRSLAACEMSNLGLHVTNFPDYTKAKVLASKAFSKGDYIGPLFGYIVYRDLTLQSSFSRLSIDGKEEFSVSSTDFDQRSVKLSLEGREFVTIQDDETTYWKNAWVVPCRFCICGFIRKLSSLRMSVEEDYTSYQSDLDVLSKESNVSIRLTEESFLTIPSITDPYAVRVIATEAIKPGDEILLS